MKQNIPIVVLAGGSSSRFGRRPKGLVEIAGRPLISWVLDALSSLGAERALEIGANDGADFEKFGVPLLKSATDGRGALLGVQSALTWASKRHDVVAIAPCDVPNISA